MKRCLLASTILPVVLIGCSSGPPSPPSLSYAMPSSPDVRYAYGDTTVVSINAMGQSMELSMRGEADYDVHFSPEQSGVGVTMSLASLSASVVQPMGAPLRFDEGEVEGELAFSLDRTGNPALTAEPDVSDAASQIVSGISLAHGFFPGLPGRAVGPGDTWVDTIQYEADLGEGTRSEYSIFRYTVVGDTTVSSRSMLAISLDGTTETEIEMNAAGMLVSVSGEMTVEGLVLWDVRNGMLHEAYRIGTGNGTVAAPIAPVPFPIEIETTQRVRIQGM